MNRPVINEEMLAKINRDARAYRPQQRPDGTWQPSPWEMRITLVMVIVVVFVLFWIAPR